MTTVVVHWCYINKTESTEVVFLLILFKSNLYCRHSLNCDQLTECSLLFLTPLFCSVLYRFGAVFFISAYKIKMDWITWLSCYCPTSEVKVKKLKNY